MGVFFLCERVNRRLGVYSGTLSPIDFSGEKDMRSESGVTIVVLPNPRGSRLGCLGFSGNFCCGVMIFKSSKRTLQSVVLGIANSSEMESDKSGLLSSDALVLLEELFCLLRNGVVRYSGFAVSSLAFSSEVNLTLRLWGFEGVFSSEVTVGTSK